MSIVTIFMVLLLVSIHACNARHSPGFGIYHKDNMTNDETKLTHEMDIKSLSAFGNTKETFSEDTSISITTLDESQSTFQMQGLERRERTMLESETHETKEPSNANEDEPIEDAVVMDYVTPHRKSPIHNSHH